MPVAVPNSFNEQYYQNNSVDNNRYNNNFLSSQTNNLMDENQSYHIYLNRLHDRIRRLESINDIFLNIMRENVAMNKRSLYKNYSSNDLSAGPYPYLLFDRNNNKTLLYLNRDSINNNKIINGKYKEKYLLPILPKYNSIQEKNRISYLLNEEKLKNFDKDSKPYFSYNLQNYKLNIPQKINSVQYFNNKIDFKKFNSTDKINIQVNEEKNSKGKSSKNTTKKSSNRLIKTMDIKEEINKLNDNLNKRLSKIENLQKIQKKDIDYLMSKSKGNNTALGSKKEENKKDENNKKENKKEEEKKNNDKSDEESDDEEEEEEDEEEKELGIKSIKSN